MQHNDNIISHGLNPTFLFTWKGVRTKDEERYHSHDYLELAFVMSGCGKYLIDDVIYDIQEGDLLVFNPGVCHQAIADPSCPATEFFIGATDFSLEGMPVNSLIIKNMPVYKTGTELKQKLMRLCVSMDAEKDTCYIGRYYMMQSYLMQFLLHVLRAEQEPKASHASGVHTGSQYSLEYAGKKEIVSHIVEYISEHYSEKLSLDVISGNMYVSPFYISKSFKAVTGDTPIRYLINVRLDKAKELLEQNPDLSISEAAEAVGYDDAYHFSKLFKKRFGVSPSKVKTS